MSLRRITLIAVAALAVLIPLGWVGVEAAYGRFEAPPALVEGVEFEWGDDNSPLDQRLRALFPVGSADATVAQGLRAQGVELRGKRRAQQAWGGLDCQHYVEVDWQADANGRLTSISANYGKTC